MGAAGGPRSSRRRPGCCLRLIAGKTIESVPPSLYHVPVNCLVREARKYRPRGPIHTRRNFSAAPASPGADQVRCLAELRGAPAAHPDVAISLAITRDRITRII